MIETNLDSAQPSGRALTLDTLDRLDGDPQRKNSQNLRLFIAADNRTLIGHQGKEIVLWDLQTGKVIRHFAAPDLVGNRYKGQVAILSTDGKTLTTNLATLQRWDLTTGQPQFDLPPEDGLGEAVQCLAFTTQGNEILAGSWRSVAARWNIVTGKRVAITQGSVPPLFSTAKGVITIHASEGKDIGINVDDAVAGKHIRDLHWEVASSSRPSFMVTDRAGQAQVRKISVLATSQGA